MPKKIFIPIVLVILVLIALGVLYYLGLPGEEIMKKEKIPKEEAVEEKPAEEKAALSEIVSIYLVKFPAGIELGPGMREKGIKTSTFEKGDLIGIEGEVKLPEGKEKVVLTSQVFDKEGKKLEGIYTPEIEIKGASFGSCCITTPQEPGKYTVKFFLDGKEVKSLNFEVREK
jgi:hypothetical protein